MSIACTIVYFQTNRLVTSIQSAFKLIYAILATKLSTFLKFLCILIKIIFNFILNDPMYLSIEANFTLTILYVNVT